MADQKRPLFSEWAKDGPKVKRKRTREHVQQYRSPRRIYVERVASTAGTTTRVLAAAAGALMTEAEARDSGAWPEIQRYPV